MLGLSTAVVPTPVPGQPAKTPLARVQMALKASFLPAEGFLGVSAAHLRLLHPLGEMPADRRVRILHLVREAAQGR